MDNIIKVRIDTISYNKVLDLTICSIYFSVIVNGEVINTFHEVSKSSCKEEDTFNKKFGEDLSRAYTELKIYKRIIEFYASDIVLNTLYDHFHKDYNKTLNCMINTRKYYKTLIKKQYKYINSLKNNETN